MACLRDITTSIQRSSFSIGLTAAWCAATAPNSSGERECLAGQREIWPDLSSGDSGSTARTALPDLCILHTDLSEMKQTRKHLDRIYLQCIIQSTKHKRYQN